MRVIGLQQDVVLCVYFIFHFQGPIAVKLKCYFLLLCLYQSKSDNIFLPWEERLLNDF